MSPPCSTSYRTGNMSVSLWGEDFSNAVCKDQRLWKALCHDCEMNGEPKIATALKSFSEYYKCFYTFILLTLYAGTWLRKGMCMWVRYHGHGRGLQSPWRWTEPQLLASRLTRELRIQFRSLVGAGCVEPSPKPPTIVFQSRILFSEWYFPQTPVFRRIKEVF